MDRLVCLWSILRVSYFLCGYQFQFVAIKESAKLIKLEHVVTLFLLSGDLVLGGTVTLSRKLGLFIMQLS